VIHVGRHGQATACIREMYDKSRYNRKHNKKHGADDTGKKENAIMDKYCSFCGTYGHATNTCEFMAQLINATEKLNKVDIKVKKEIQEHFRQKQKQHRAKRLSKQTNVIRKLLDTGVSREDIKAALIKLGYHNEDDHNSIHNNNSYDDTTSTSE
jgi:hypothetical protein